MSIKKSMLFAAGSITIMAVSSPQDGVAMPTYARQTGLSCSACHFQRYPLLNGFGRSFKATGYTQKGKQYTIEDANLSLPTTLNAALISKFRYQKTNGSDATDVVNKGAFQLPDEASLFLAGRVAQNIGFQADITIKDGGAGLAGFKMPFIFPQTDYTFMAIPFFTDAQGAAYGYELLNTAAVEYSRVFEHAKETSAQQYIVKDPNAIWTSGVSLVAQHKKYGYISFTPYTVAGDIQEFAPQSFMSYIRAVYTHPDKVGNFELAGGVQVWTGDTKVGPSAGTITTHASAWALDFQAQGKTGDYPLGVYVTYATAAKTDPADLGTDRENMFNMEPNDKKAFTVSGDLGLVPSRLGVQLAYRVANAGVVGDDKENAFTIGATYNVAKNVSFQLNHSMYSYGIDVPHDGDSKTTLMMFSAF
ncbi:MAG: hypothetical protein ACOYLR_04085 [Chlorobium sp.]